MDIFGNKLRLFSKKATPEEVAQVEAWAQESEENLQELKALEALFQASEDMKGYQSFDKKLAWQKITQKTGTNPVRPLNSWRKYAAVAASLIIVVAASIWYTTTQVGVPSAIGQEFVTSDVQQKFDLQDGTEVNLDANSSLIITGYRSVALRGKAYFKVTKSDENDQFSIQTGLGKVTVLGTQFVVHSSKENFEVAVEEGKVRFDDESRSITLKAHEKINITDGTLTKQIIQNSNEFSWVSGHLHFDNTPLKMVFSDLQRHFGIEINVLPNVQLGNECLLTTSFQNESLDSIMGELALLFGLQFEKQSKKIIIKAAKC